MYFPIFLDLSDSEILVVGAGRIASRRIRVLREFAGHITVTAPEISRETERMASEGGPVTLLRRKFAPEDLDGKTLVLAATDDPELNRSIALQSRERGIPVNNCSDQGLCDFQFPSVICFDGITAGLNASGRDHRLVREARRRVERALGESAESRYDD